MLVTLIRRYSKPYLPYILAVIAFQLASTIAALYLPSLNAQIIDEGVSRGDTDFIWRTGAVMLLVAFLQVGTAIAGVYFGSKTAMAVFEPTYTPAMAVPTRRKATRSMTAPERQMKSVSPRETPSSMIWALRLGR